MEKHSSFEGFDSPESNWFRMPYQWVDIVSDLKLGERAVLEYILRHTWGFLEFDVPKKITLDEFVSGRRLKDRSRMDSGTGVSRRAVVDALKSLSDAGYIEEFVDDRDRGRVKKSYMLKLKAGVQNLHPRAKDLPPEGSEREPRGANFAPRTEKETLERTVSSSSSQNGSKLGSPTGIEFDLKSLPDVDHPSSEVKEIADWLGNALDDPQSNKMWFLVASKIPHRVIRDQVRTIEVDGDAENPAAVFVKRIKDYGRRMVN